MKTSGASVALALLLGLALGGAGGFTAGARGDRGTPSHATPSAGEAILSELRQEMARLFERVDSLSVLVAESRSARSREPSQPDARVSTTALEAIVGRLERALDEPAVRNSLSIPVGRPNSIPPKPEDEQVLSQLRSRFQLMTYQEALDALGKPDQVLVTQFGGGDVLSWVYLRDPQHEPDEMGQPFYLHFRDGLVVDISP